MAAPPLSSVMGCATERSLCFSSWQIEEYAWRIEGRGFISKICPRIAEWRQRAAPVEGTRYPFESQRCEAHSIEKIAPTITSSGTKKGEFLAADVNTQLKNKNITTDIKVDTSSNLFTTITVDEPAPGLKTIFSFKVPDQRSGKVEVQYLHEYAAVSSSVGLTVNPTVNFSGVIGTNVASLGTDLSFDTKTGDFIKCNAGVSLSKVDLIASLTLNNKGDSLNASYYHIVNPLTAVGAEVSHSFSSNENTITVGAQHSLDPLTTLKARVNNAGKASALVQHEWRPKSFFTVSGEVDTKAIEKTAKVGLALALKS